MSKNIERCVDENPDDKGKNGVKTYIFGKYFWAMYHLLGHDLSNFDPDLFGDFVQFMMLSPQDLLPCVHCRKSFRGYIKLPEYNICTYMNSQSLDDFMYLIHGVVNQKLRKEQPKSFLLEQFKVSPFPHYEKYFWKWIQNIAFNYPADIQLVDYYFCSSPQNRQYVGQKQHIRKISKYDIGSPEDTELRKRMKSYILFFDLLKNFIRVEEPIFEKWLDAYMKHPPTPFTFSSRTQLLKWIHEMKIFCNKTHSEFENNYHPQDAPYSCEHNPYQENESFMSMMEEFHPTRSTSFL